MWAKKGFERKIDIRFPAGKGNARKCLYAWWKVDDTFRKLGYIDGRKHIYLPLYAKAVVKTEAFRRLVELRDSGKNLMLIDFDGYNPWHPHYGFTSYSDVIHCPLLKMGHSFVLAMLLDGVIRVEDGEVKYADGLMEPTGREYSPELRKLTETYSKDLRKLTDEEKLIRGARAGGVTLEEWTALSPSDRTLFRVAARKKNVYARGFTRAAWMRLPMAEKFAAIRGANCR